MSADDVPFQERPAHFWAWFKENEDRLAAIDAHDDPFLNDALRQLQAVDDGLFLEVGTNCEPKEFVITACGNTKLFPLIDILASTAPPIPGWQIVALKPAMGFDFKTNYEGIEYNPKKMWFLPLVKKHDPTFLGLRIGVEKLPSGGGEEAYNAVATILETGLGERSFAEEVGHLEVVALPAKPEEEGYMELVDLPRYIPWRKLRAAS